eukprot:scaffold542132_cov41-Prasinocladus_malaysianus.AAC.2
MRPSHSNGSDELKLYPQPLFALEQQDDSFNQSERQVTPPVSASGTPLPSRRPTNISNDGDVAVTIPAEKKGRTSREHWKDESEFRRVEMDLRTDLRNTRRSVKE